MMPYDDVTGPQRVNALQSVFIYISMKNMLYHSFMIMTQIVTKNSNDAYFQPVPKHFVLNIV